MGEISKKHVSRFLPQKFPEEFVKKSFALNLINLVGKKYFSKFKIIKFYGAIEKFVFRARTLDLSFGTNWSFPFSNFSRQGKLEDEVSAALSKFSKCPREKINGALEIQKRPSRCGIGKFIN